jgi:hypothetical protein
MGIINNLPILNITNLQSEVMGIGTLMPYLLVVPVWDGGASAPKGADALCPQHLDILPSRRAASGGEGMERNATEGCPGGEDTRHRPLREPMPKRRSNGVVSSALVIRSQNDRP